ASEIIGDFFAAHCESSTAIHKAEKLSSTIHPNPVLKQLHIECEASISSITIHDAKGRQLSEMRNINAFSVNINCAQLTPGLYFIKIIAEDGRLLTSKFVKN
ncbi:MAG: T9SS type A sorting domain-containing protein, partial [Bacteroidota bacterium]|nr:T9SS type A sorting domain-containing protein [Bacteroidota bacterium]